ncbi:AraC family transcriptional regulator [Treponema sp.]|uniref:AraC family transcriptional regulator n=1 Tax=Treponema sp. TaxID=166 RepID=UPI0025CFEADB|nr:AraC family transcriptional regulator [Treponema sp.]MBR4320983.1 AraC family transcriptional regulator [Treponema sp.]
MQGDFRFDSEKLGFTFIKKTHAVTNPRRHFHPWWEILYITSGQRTFFYGSKTVQARAGTFLIVTPGVLHRAINPEGETCSLYNVFFESESFTASKNLVDDIHSIFPRLEPFIQLGDETMAKVKGLFERMEEEITLQKENFEVLARALLSEIIVLVSREANAGDFHESTYAMSENFSEILAWMNSHYEENLTLPLVAKKFNITPSHLSRSFKSFTQFSFVEYINSLRIAQSCKLLRGTKMSVLDIALKCGFGSVTQYGRWFKKLVGKSPVKYRNS